MDIQPVTSHDGLFGYCTKYVTKNDNPDMFRDFRDDTGKPIDAGANISRTEIPVQRHNIPKLISKLFNDQIKYSMISSPELLHNMLDLPLFFSSRSFLKISLQSDLNKLLAPSEVNMPDQSIGENPQFLLKEDLISIYEKRCDFCISSTNIKMGVTEETIKNMSLFLFHKHFFVRTRRICKKPKTIIIFRPYISPKKKNNEKYHQYMVLTLLAYKPFRERKEFISISEQDLEKIFNQFLKSDACPFFIKEKYQKSNKKKVHKKKDKESEVFTNKDDFQEGQMESSSDEESDYEFDEIGRIIRDNYKEQDVQTHKSTETELIPEMDESNQVPHIAKFTEAYQEYGHMAPKGLEYEGVDFDFFDNDNDVQEEINVLSDKQDLIFNSSKEDCKSEHSYLKDLAVKAQETIRQKTGVRKTSQYLDPNDLDPTQSLFLDTVLEWERQCVKCIKEKKPFPPLKVKLLGVAGTGKSRTIKTLVQEFNKVMTQSDLPVNEHGKIIMCAPTGVAAFNIGCGAASVHKTFDIPVGSDFNDLTGDKATELELKFENVWLVIIDEISMVGCEMLAKINERLVQAKLSVNEIFEIELKNPSLRRPAFGGVGMVLCGDFGQLIPIMQHSLMDNIRLPLQDLSKPKNRFTNKGKGLIEEFKISIILSKQHRQIGTEYTSLCLKFRDGSFSPVDHIKLQNRDYEQVPLREIEQIEKYGTRLVTTNKNAGNYNAKKLIETAKINNKKIFRLQAHETEKKRNQKEKKGSLEHLLNIFLVLNP